MSIQSVSTAATPFVNAAVKEFSQSKISHQLIALMGSLFQIHHKQNCLTKEARNHTKELLTRVTKEETTAYSLQALACLLKIPSVLQIGSAYQMGFQVASDSSNVLFQGSLNAKRASKEEAQQTLSELAQNSSTLSSSLEKLMEVLRQIQQHDGVK